PTDWAAFGDFVGGFLTPVLTFFSLLGLLFTIQQANKALAASRDALRSQDEQAAFARFQTSFYASLDSLERFLSQDRIAIGLAGGRAIDVMIRSANQTLESSSQCPALQAGDQWA